MRPMPISPMPFRRTILLVAVPLCLLAGSTAGSAAESGPAVTPPAVTAGAVARPVSGVPAEPSSELTAPPEPSSELTAAPLPPSLGPPEPIVPSARENVAASNPPEPDLVASRPHSAAGQVSLAGPIGLFEMSTAEVGPVNQLRLGLHGEYFSASSLLVSGDSDQRLRGGLMVGYTLHPQIELFGGVLTSSNRNDRERDPGDRDPALLRSFGDIVLGAKAGRTMASGATLSLELGLKLLAGASQLSISPSSTSLWIGPVFSYDFAAGGHRFPLRLHGAASYFFDNSSNLNEDLSRYSRNTKEVAMFAYGIAQSRVRLAVGADAPFGADRLPIPLDPFLEYHVEVATGSGDPAFADYGPPQCGLGAGFQSCIDNRDTQWLTLGARAAVYGGLVAAVGVDLRVRSVGFPYGTPLPPYNVIFGLSLPVDLGVFSRPRVVTKVVERAPQEGFITGTVVGGVPGERSGVPVAGAIVTVTGRAHARVATDPDGGFTTLSLPPGAAELEVTAPSYEPLKVVTTVVAGRGEPVLVTLAARVPTASVHGRVTNREGRGLEATVKFTGRGKTDGNFEARSDATGAYALTLPVGTYRARTDAPGLPVRDADLDLVAGDNRALDFTLRPAPASPNVQLAGEWLKLRRALRFVGTTAELTPPSEKMLDAVAELLEAHVEIRHVQIIAHWDSSLPGPEAQALTQKQAEAVKAYLVAHGIAADRLTTSGAGSTRPLVPSLSPASRQRNQRVELHLE